MKLLAVCSVIVTFCVLPVVDSASVSLSSSQLSIEGNAYIRFDGAREVVWSGLTDGHRYPMINSGDTIALRSAYTFGSLKSHWLSCTSTSCGYNICPGTLITSSEWTSCSGNMKFFIRAMNKMDGQPINSGDTVSIIPTSYGSPYRLRCDTATTYKCRVSSTTSSFKGNAWLTYSYATFQIFARNAVDGTPLQYGDLVAFKYPYGGRSRWLSYYSYYYYARDCSANSKSSCARQNTYTGFKIFKKL
ncbi:uncharacterized protein LOC114963294 [Acropora millepora]|uniref:uncharacterized protein LOC114963294 n=1 Tax=Acropora millepora TaxID=45264 RepID=UPI001CF146E7|nr:uncharacterized protein LOC114963294 [Acropora millepora]